MPYIRVLKIVYRFSILVQKIMKIMGIGELICVLVFFQKFSWCNTTVPNFMFLAYPSPEIRAASKNDPLDLYGP